MAGKSPYIKILNRPYTKEGINGQEMEAIFALKLDNIVATVVDNYFRKDIITQQCRGQVDFINSLYNIENKLSYELRFISRKSEGQPEDERKLEIVLLTKAIGQSAAKVAAKFSTILPVVLSSRLPNYEFLALDSEKELEKGLNPFAIKHVAEIRRRHHLLPISTLKRDFSAGFFSDGAKSRASDKDCAYYVFPFIHRENDFSVFIRMLLDVNQNLIFSCLLIPTMLDNTEIEFMNQQVAKCEKARSDYSESNQSYRDRATCMISVYEDQISKLIDAPFLVQIRIASDEPINSAILETIGVEITEYQSSKTSYYAGGYDVVCPKNQEQAEQAVSAFVKLEPCFIDHPEEFGRWRFLFDAKEANCAFRLPLAINDNLVGLKITHVKPLPLPKEVKGLINSDRKKTKIGLHSWSGQNTQVYISDDDRLRHVYTVGQTGTGKTTLLKNMILEDMTKGDGVIVIDPHGDLFNEITGLIPENRLDDVIILDPMDLDYPVGLNLLEWQTREEKYFLIKEVQEIIRRMLEDEYGSGAVLEFTGPVFYHYMEMGLLLVMSHPTKKATIFDFFELFQNNKNKDKWIVDSKHYDDETLKSWVEDQLKDIDFMRRGSQSDISMGEYITGKIKDFIFDPKVREIFNQEKSTIDLKEIMNGGKILLVNLAKGELSERSSRFLGMVLMAKIMSAALERIKLPKEDRKPVYVYVDEFQNIATSTFSILLSEARKFGVGLVLANQFMSQIKQMNIMEAIFGNVSTIISFRVGLRDAELLDAVFLPTIDRNSLINLPNWQAAVRTSVDGRITTPFYMKTELSPNPSEEIRTKARQRSRKEYGRKKLEGEPDKSGG